MPISRFLLSIPFVLGLADAAGAATLIYDESVDGDINGRPDIALVAGENILRGDMANGRNPDTGEIDTSIRDIGDLFSAILPTGLDLLRVEITTSGFLSIDNRSAGSFTTDVTDPSGTTAYCLDVEGEALNFAESRNCVFRGIHGSFFVTFDSTPVLTSTGLSAAVQSSATIWELRYFVSEGPVGAVPLPAGFGLLLCSLGGLWGARRLST